MSHAASSFDLATATPTMTEPMVTKFHTWEPAELQILVPFKPAEPASPNELKTQPTSYRGVAEQGGRKWMQVRLIKQWFRAPHPAARIESQGSTQLTWHSSALYLSPCPSKPTVLPSQLSDGLVSSLLILKGKESHCSVYDMPDVTRKALSVCSYNVNFLRFLLFT